MRNELGVDAIVGVITTPELGNISPGAPVVSQVRDYMKKNESRDSLTVLYVLSND
jgi:hypothetical protein